jgi:hypothetical protein
VNHFNCPSYSDLFPFPTSKTCRSHFPSEIWQSATNYIVQYLDTTTSPISLVPGRFTLSNYFQPNRTAVSAIIHLCSQFLSFIHPKVSILLAYTIIQSWLLSLRFESTIIMPSISTIILLITCVTLTSAFPHHLQPSPVNDPLEMPMHTTALMAGAAWDLTYSATATRLVSTIPTPAPAQATGLDLQYEL